MEFLINYRLKTSLVKKLRELQNKQVEKIERIKRLNREHKEKQRKIQHKLDTVEGNYSKLLIN